MSTILAVAFGSGLGGVRMREGGDSDSVGAGPVRPVTGQGPPATGTASPGPYDCSAPEGQRATCAATSAALAASGLIQRFRLMSKTPGSPRMHFPEWMHMAESKVTVISGVL